MHCTKSIATREWARWKETRMSMGLIFEHWPNCKLFFSFCHFRRETCWRQSVIANLFLAFPVCVRFFYIWQRRWRRQQYFFWICSSNCFSSHPNCKVDLLQVLVSSFFCCSTRALDMLPSILTWRSERYLSMSFWIQIN